MIAAQKILTDEMVAKIEALAPRYPNRRALTLPALHIVNAELLHVPLEAVAEIEPARALDGGGELGKVEEALVEGGGGVHVGDGQRDVVGGGWGLRGGRGGEQERGECEHGLAHLLLPLPSRERAEVRGCQAAHRPEPPSPNPLPGGERAMITRLASSSRGR